MLPVGLFVALYLGLKYIMTLTFLLASIVWAWHVLPQSTSDTEEKDVEPPESMELYL